MDTESAEPTGGAFLLAPPTSVFAPEIFNDQQRLIARTAEDFARQEITPAGAAIESQDTAIIRGLLRQAGTVGLTGVDVPETYGGQGLELTASAIVADRMAVQGSFSVIFGAHVGIGTLPLVHFGSPAQKRRYLPRLATAEWIGAYALSEAESGSDALALKTQAEPAGDGSHFLLRGEKMWISNAGIADLFTVFGKVGGRVTAFLVEATEQGVTTGPEEHKMGIHGSSTRPLHLRDVRVPSSAVLGEVGGGAQIAFQILNIGRFKLAAACIGGARNVLREAAEYARNRHAFGKPIASFGLVQQMLARMAIDIFAAESAVYRTAGLLAHAASLEEFAVECSMVKVHASEMLDRVADWAVQIHGGNGFIRGPMAEQAYRDSRVNRIFEGTNEINRLLISTMLLRRAEKGTLALPAAVDGVTNELLTTPAHAPETPWEQARKAAILAAGIAQRRFRDELAQQQEILAMIADALVSVYVMQAAAIRRPECALTQAVVAAEMDNCEVQCRGVIAATSTGDELRTHAAWLRRLLQRPLINTVVLQRRIAAEVLEARGYSV